MSRTWEENAQEFGALTRQGKDVRLALLVACSVERGTGGPRTAPVGAVKVSARQFSDAAGLGQSGQRVLRHLDAWDPYAEKQGLPLAADLTPEHALTLDITEAQAEAFYLVKITQTQKPEPVNLEELYAEATSETSDTTPVVQVEVPERQATQPQSPRVVLAEPSTARNRWREIGDRMLNINAELTANIQAVEVAWKDENQIDDPEALWIARRAVQTAEEHLSMLKTMLGEIDWNELLEEQP